MSEQTLNDWSFNGYPPERKYLPPDDAPLDLWVSGGCVWADNPSDNMNPAVNVSLSPRLGIEPPSRFVMDDRWTVTPVLWHGTYDACEEQLARIVDLMKS